MDDKNTVKVLEDKELAAKLKAAMGAAKQDKPVPEIASDEAFKHQ